MITISQQIKTLKGRFGICYFCDCLDEHNGMQTQEQRFYLGLTDPPYNVGIGKLNADLKRINGGGLTKNTMKYEDKKPKKEYDEWCHKWLEIMMEKCSQVVVTPGNSNFRSWTRYKYPKEIMVHYKTNGSSFTHSVHNAKYDMILAYGNIRPFEFKENEEEYIKAFNLLASNDDAYQMILAYGKLRPFEFKVNVFETNSNDSFNKFLKHPCPKPKKLWDDLIDDAIREDHTRAILDPFVGSGTTPECCEERGIPWVGYEISLDWYEDIKLRIKWGMDNNIKNNIKGLSRY